MEKEFILDNRKKLNLECGVYFLIKGNEIVYVGQTTKGISRITQHIGVKDFDTYYFKEVKEEDLLIVEERYIIKFKPRLNKTFAALTSLTKLKKKMKSLGADQRQHHLRNLKKIISVNNIETQSLNSCIYLNKNSVEKVAKILGVL